MSIELRDKSFTLLLRPDAELSLRQSIARSSSSEAQRFYLDALDELLHRTILLASGEQAALAGNTDLCKALNIVRTYGVKLPAGSMGDERLLRFFVTRFIEAELQ